MQDLQAIAHFLKKGVIASQPDILLVTKKGIKGIGGIEKLWEFPV